jgi:hypothetical protein
VHRADPASGLGDADDGQVLCQGLRASEGEVAFGEGQPGALQLREGRTAHADEHGVRSGGCVALRGGGGVVRGGLRQRYPVEAGEAGLAAPRGRTLRCRHLDLEPTEREAVVWFSEQTTARLVIGTAQATRATSA